MARREIDQSELLETIQHLPSDNPVRILLEEFLPTMPADALAAMIVKIASLESTKLETGETLDITEEEVAKDALGKDLLDEVKGKLIFLPMLEAKIFNAVHAKLGGIKKEGGVPALDAYKVAAYSVKEYKNIDNIAAVSIQKIRSVLEFVAKADAQALLEEYNTPYLPDAVSQKLEGSWLSWDFAPFRQPGQIGIGVHTKILSKFPEARETHPLGFDVINPAFFAKKSVYWYLRFFSEDEIDELVLALNELSTLNVEVLVPKDYRPLSESPEKYKGKKIRPTHQQGDYDKKVFKLLHTALAAHPEYSHICGSDHIGDFIDGYALAQLSWRQVSKPMTVSLGAGSKKYLIEYFES